MATKKATALSPEQRNTLQALHTHLDLQAVSGPGAPDTPFHREARELRTMLENAFPDAFAPAATGG